MRLDRKFSGVSRRTKLNNLSHSIIRKKLLAIILLITFIFSALIGRLVYLQIVSAQGITLKGSDQWSRDLPMMAKRGQILDRNGVIIADSSTQYKLYVRPNALKNHAKVARTIADVLSKDYDKTLEKISKKGVSEITVAKKITKAQMINIASLNYDGVYFAEESVRYFPYGDFLTQVLGFTNVDGYGQSGLEQYYDKYLRGVDGKILTQTDLVGKELENNKTQYIPAIDGMNATLTIDYYIQTFAEKAVRNAIIEYGAKGANCMVMNPRTGEIYAMAQAPSYDLNNIPRDDVGKLFEMSKNSMILNVYEPGSTFKILTSAIGMEENAINNSYYCNGARMVDGQRIKCWQSKGHGSQSFEQGVYNSCNCVFMDIATQVGTNTMYDYLKKFGVNQKTGVDMLGEGRGLMLNQASVKNVDIARIGFGQAIAVTPIGLCTAVSSCINGGYKVTPHILSNMTDKNFGKVIDNNYGKGEQIVSSKTSSTLTNYLYGVVEKGSGKRAYVPGYRIGGKTGTAQKYANGAIAQGKYISSFLGFTEVLGEEYLCLMTVDEPQGYVYYGSIVAAPFVGDVFKNIFAYKNAKPNYTEEELKLLGRTFTMPNLMDMNADEAIAILKRLKIPFEYNGTGGKVNYQLPAANSTCNYNTVAFINFE